MYIFIRHGNFDLYILWKIKYIIKTNVTSSSNLFLLCLLENLELCMWPIFICIWWHCSRMFLLLRKNTNPKFCTLYLQNNSQEENTFLWLPDTVTSVFATCDLRLRLQGPFRPLLRRISIGSQRFFPWDKAVWRDSTWDWLEALAQLVCLISLERHSLLAWLKRGGNDFIRKYCQVVFRKASLPQGHPHSLCICQWLGRWEGQEKE